MGAKTTTVIPAKAGIHNTAPYGTRMDSRLRGNDEVAYTCFASHRSMHVNAHGEVGSIIINGRET